MLSNTDENVIFNLYDGNDKIELKENKTNKIHVSKKSKYKHDYRLEVIYDNTKTVSADDILENIQIKVHSEQSKA